MGGFSLWHWLVVLLIVVLVFGTKRLKNVGKDLGEAVKGFKQGVHDDDASDVDRPAARLPDDSRPTSPDARTGAETPRGDATERNDPPSR